MSNDTKKPREFWVCERKVKEGLDLMIAVDYPPPYQHDHDDRFNYFHTIEKGYIDDLQYVQEELRKFINKSTELQAQCDRLAAALAKIESMSPEAAKVKNESKL